MRYTYFKKAFGLLLAVVFAAGPIADSAFADPPSWAPAHGRRAKNGESESAPAPQPARMALPPSLDGGRCHFDKLTGKKLGLIVGATIGAAIGAGAARDEDRAFATALGAVIGALVGKTIGEALSENSRRCITEALEHAPDRQTITWHDSDAKLDYALTPTRSFTGDAGKPCRDYVIDASDSATSKHADGSACRYGDNAWQILK